MKPFHYILLVPLLGLSHVGCNLYPNEREDCDGQPYVANDVLPDTVQLQISGPDFEFDLSEAQVFKHTADQGFNYRASVSDTGLEIVGTFVGFTSGELRLFPRKVGSTRVIITAEDACERLDTLGIFVQVVEANPLRF